MYRIAKNGFLNIRTKKCFLFCVKKTQPHCFCSYSKTATLNARTQRDARNDKCEETRNVTNRARKYGGGCAGATTTIMNIFLRPFFSATTTKLH